MRRHRLWHCDAKRVRTQIAQCRERQRTSGSTWCMCRTGKSKGVARVISSRRSAPISDETVLKAYRIFERHVSGLWPDRGTTYCWDEDDKPVRPGEIVAKCEGQMRRFWNNPEATAERIVDR
jgi:hypothetical protein